MFSGTIAGLTNSFGNPFYGTVDGLASYFGAFSGIVNGVASFFSAFSGSVTGTANVGGGGGFTDKVINNYGNGNLPDKVQAKAGANTLSTYVDPTENIKALTAEPKNIEMPESIQQATAQMLPNVGKEINVNFGDINLDLSSSDVDRSEAREIGNDIGEGMVEVLTKELRRIGG